MIRKIYVAVILIVLASHTVVALTPQYNGNWSRNVNVVQVGMNSQYNGNWSRRIYIDYWLNVWSDKWWVMNDSVNITITAPSVVTNDSTGIEEKNATLWGYLQDDGNESCSVWFEWGTTTSYGNTTTAENKTSPSNFSYNLTNLQPGTLYHYRAVANNSNSTSYGSDKTFLTKPYEPSNFIIESINSSALHLSWTKGEGAKLTRIRYSASGYPATPNSGNAAYDDTGSSFYLKTNLEPGTKYYFRGWSYTYEGALSQYSDLYIEGFNYTYPSEPYNISTSASGYAISLSWSKGNGSDYTLIRYSTSGYPTSVTEGTEAYNDTGTSTTVSGLQSNTTYYFSFWAYDSESGYYSQSYSTASNTTLDVPPNPSNLVATTHNHTAIYLSWTASTSVNSVLVRKVGSYPANQSDGTIVYNNTGTSYQDTGLTPSTHYYYRVWTYNGMWSESYSQDEAWTKPEPPQNVSYTLNTTGTYANLTINWDIGQGADKTVIRKNLGDPPATPDDGTLVYNGTGNSTYDNITQAFSYRLWSYNETSGLYSDYVDLGWFAIWLNCYNESTGEPISGWSVFISNEEGTQTYTATNCSNSHILNLTLCPTGTHIAFKFSASGYYSRFYYIDIEDVNTSYALNAYLPPYVSNPSAPYGGGGGNGTNGTTNETVQTQLYLITVLTEYDEPVEDAYIVFKHYDPATETYVNVSFMYTDANGQVNIHLIPNDVYKVIITKTGYQTEISDYIPSDQIFTHTFVLKAVEEEPTPPQAEPEEVIFEGYISGNTLYLNYTDSMNQTNNTQIYIYEINTSTGTTTLFGTNTTTYTSIFQVNFTNINTSNTYKVILHFNHTTFGHQTKTLIFSGNYTQITQPNKVDSLLNILIGGNPFGWGNLLMFFFLVAAFLYADQRDAGKILVLIGGVFLFINIVIGFNTTFMTVAGGAIPILFIIVGILLIWKENRKEEGVS